MKVMQIREAGRATQGVKLINIDEGDKIAAIASIQEQDVVEEETDAIEATVTGEEVATGEGDLLSENNDNSTDNPDQQMDAEAENEPTDA